MAKSKSSNEVCAKCERLEAPRSPKRKESDTWISCEECEKWFHTICENINDEQYKLLKGATNITWKCDTCKNKQTKGNETLTVETLTKLLQQMETRLAKNNSNLKEELEQVVQEKCLQMGEEIERNMLKELDNKLKMNSTKEKEKIDPKGGDVQAWIRGELEEHKIRINKNNNVVITGLTDKPEQTTEEMARWITQTLSLEDGEVKVEEVYRIGKESNKTRPILVKLQNKSMQKKILINSKRLAENEKTRKIYINPDLTKKQQEERFRERQDIREGKHEQVVGNKASKGQTRNKQKHNDEQIQETNNEEEDGSKTNKQ